MSGVVAGVCRKMVWWQGGASAPPFPAERQLCPTRSTGIAGDVPTNEFTSSDVYAFTRELEKLHPDNRHVRDKIRQQLQVLRDAGLLLHIGRGRWQIGSK